jgi:hypothetical protein
MRVHMDAFLLRGYSSVAHTPRAQEARRAAVADSQAMDLKVQLGRLQNELATTSAALAVTKEAAEKSEKESRLALQHARQEVEEKSVTVMRLGDQCAALAEHGRLLDEQVCSLEQALAAARTEVGANISHVVSLVRLSNVPSGPLLLFWHQCPDTPRLQHAPKRAAKLARCLSTRGTLAIALQSRSGADAHG